MRFIIYRRFYTFLVCIVAATIFSRVVGLISPLDCKRTLCKQDTSHLNRRQPANEFYPFSGRILVDEGRAVLLGVPITLSVIENHASVAIADDNVAEISAIISSQSAAFDEKILINGLISGAAINAAKNLILHPMETVKTRLDTGARDVSVLMADVYSGIGPAMVGGVPAAAVFFGAKDLIRNFLRHSGIAPGPATILSVTLASFPYWALRNPSEVIKTRMRTGAAASSSFSEIVFQGQISDLYSGLTSNLLYSLPSDWLKFIFYEYFASTLFGLQEGQSVDGLAAIVCGSLGALVAETICTPLDVARIRIMCMSKDSALEIVEDKQEQEVAGEMVAGMTLLTAQEGCTLASSAMSQISDNISGDGGSSVAEIGIITGYPGPGHSPRGSDSNSAKAKDTATPNPLVVIWDIIIQEKLSNLFAGGVPRSTRALLDGAVQFYAYETSQNILHSLNF